MKQRNNFLDWLVFAGEDLRVAELVFREGIFNQVCFHSQQTVEKSLKALIKFKSVSVPKIHNLTELFNISTRLEEKVGSVKEACHYLDRFYSPTRYPDAFPGSLAERLPNKQEAEMALSYALSVYELVQKLLS